MIHIVDDDANVRDSTSFLLQSRGFQTESHSDGRAFLEKETLEGECVLLDLRMPDMTGLDVQQALASRNIHLPVIMLSGHGDTGIAVEAMRMGAVAYIEKPYQEDDLVAAIARASKLPLDGEKVRADAIARVERLAPAERRTLQGLLAGLSTKQLARILDLSSRSVEEHCDLLLDSLEVGSIAGAIRIGLDAQLEPLTA